MTVTACNINTWTNPKFQLGGPCNPDPALRRAALEEILKGVEICRIMKIPVLSVWPGSDGADYHFQIDYQRIDRVVHRGADRGQQEVPGARHPARRSSPSPTSRASSS